MRKYILFISLLLASSALMAEEISGSVTSENGEGIPFSSIFLRERNIGIVSDIDGHYRLPIDFLEETGDTLIFSSIGFDVVRIPIALFAKKVTAGNTDIVLTANYTLLPEVSVMPNAHEPRDYGFFHLRAASFSVTGTPSWRFMVFAENTDSITKFIQTINIRLSGSDMGEIEKLRVFFYQKTEAGFQNINVSNEDIFITDLSQRRIRHDVSEHHIPFPAEGIYVGIEWIGAQNIVQDRSRGLNLGVNTTTRVNESHSWLFMNEQWEQHPVEELKESVNTMPGIVRGIARNLALNSNFQIGITAH